jgi:ABC-type nickel/cobalt efflux system permease component RcnA
MALFGGIVPCPGATLILVYAVSQGLVAAGIAAMFAVSLGMGLTISLFALAAIFSRDALLRLARDKGPLLDRLHLFLSVAGALAISLLGAVLLLGRL